VYVCMHVCMYGSKIMEIVLNVLLSIHYIHTLFCYPTYCNLFF
jgi:hypothetical protein